VSAAVRTLARRVAARALGWLDPDRRLVAQEFDRAWYLGVYADVGAVGADPLDHFMQHGWREGRDPNGRFSVRQYLDDNPDVAASGKNPFVHYLRSGRPEGRSGEPDLGFRYAIISRLEPLDREVAALAKATLAVKPAAPERLAAALAGARTGLADLHITFSHDDYRTNVGGVQLCIQQEAARVAELGRDHLHLYPVKPWPVVRTAAEPGRLGVVLNGELAGDFTPDTVAEALAAASRGRDRSFAIHSLLGHSVEETSAIVEAAGLGEGFFWLHDYASLCAGYNLLRNRVEDCAAPPPDSAACSICIYGSWRGRHLAAHEALFRRLKLTVVSPAASTLEFWQASWDFPIAAAVVHPHARLAKRDPAPVTTEPRALRVAYLGWPADHKGWPLFRRLVQGHGEDPRYAFFHFGAHTEPGLPLAFHEVRVTAERPQAMQQALEAHEIDVVLFWPLWRETFSFTVYEAVAAGCAVITGPDSGNVAAVVADGDQGWVLSDEAALFAAFDNAGAARLSRAARRPMLYDMTLSGMTADLIPARAEA
jgi:glycosyltransferase involved in cell wall biosynthesis